MTTAAQIITDAFREAQMVALNGTVTTTEQTEALRRLNVLIPSVLGNEVGRKLVDVTVGGTYDQSQCLAVFVPEDVRIVLNLTEAQTYKLHPRPYDGQRFAVADVDDNLATYNVVLDGNGRQIEDAATLTLSTDGLVRQWFYRADLGGWVKLTDLATTDNIPFPTEFDDYFVTLLAMRLNPRYRSEGMSAESIAAFQRQESRFEARYRRPRDTQEWGSLGLLGQRARAYGGSSAAFSYGRGR